MIAWLRPLAPRGADYAGLRRSWPTDVLAGVTVGVVALPLALAFGITSGLGAEAGLVTAIVAGLVAAVLGGSNVQVSGPTGAMTVVLVPIVAQHGPGAVGVVGLMAGGLLVVAAVCRAGRFLAYVPWPVIEGFTIGIAAIIFLQQVPAALGVPKPEGENAAMVALRAVGEFASEPDWATIGIVAVVVAVMVVVPLIGRTLPASLLAVVAGTLLTQWAGLDVARIGSLPSTLPLPTIPEVDPGALGGLLSAAFAVALLAGIESLLSARVADGMTDTPKHDPDRELFGQGMANVVSPLFGGMPATGAIARTAVNVRAGARTRTSAIVHTLVLVLVVLFAGSLVARIPLAALAGVLMVTAVRMVELHNVRMVSRSTRSDFVVLVVTATATVAFDLLLAIEVGIAIAVFLALRQVARTSETSREALLLADSVVVYRLDGSLFFGVADRFLRELSAVDDVQVVILRLSQIRTLDATGARALGDVVAELESRGMTVLVKGIRPHHTKILQAVGTLDRLRERGHLFDSLDEAIDHATHHVHRQFSER